MIPKGKLKVDDIVERREEWVSAIKQAYVYTPSQIPHSVQRGNASHLIYSEIFLKI